MDEMDKMWQDPENWKWGVFYYNPKDKRLLVLKRVPAMGITLNFGHPASYLVIAGIISGLILLARFSGHK